MAEHNINNNTVKKLDLRQEIKLKNRVYTLLQVLVQCIHTFII